MKQVGIQAFKYLVEEENYDRNITYRVYMDLLSKYSKEQITIDFLKNEVNEYKKKEQSFTGYLAYNHLLDSNKYDRIQLYKAFSKLLKQYNDEDDKITINMIKSKIDENTITK